MVQKRHRVDQIISKLRRADVEFGKGKKVSGSLQADWNRRTDVLPLAAEGRRHAAGNGQGAQGAAE